MPRTCHRPSCQRDYVPNSYGGWFSLYYCPECKKFMDELNEQRVAENAKVGRRHQRERGSKTIREDHQ